MISRTLWITIATFALTACNAAQATTAPTEMPTGLPTSAPSQAPSDLPAPAPTAAPTCPEPSEGTELLRQDRMGYCLLYPEEYSVVQTAPDALCLVQGEPSFMMCHSTSAIFGVEDATGRNAAQVAADAVAGGGVIGEPASLTIAGEEAAVLPDVGGQASTRLVLFVHDDRLYRLSFILPGDEPGAAARFERLYNTVIDSFTFLPVAPPPAAATPAPGEVGSAVVAYVKDGNLLVWEEATGQTQTVVEFGDLVRVEMSDDGRMLAFVRVSPGGEGEALKSSLWVAEVTGSGAVELAQDGELREILAASPSDNVGFHCVEWIPNGHRLLSIGGGGHPWDQFDCAEPRAGWLFVFDADSGERVDPRRSPAMVRGVLASPDGGQLAVVTSSDGVRSDGLSFLDVEASLSAGVASLRPVAGLVGARPGELRGWSQDSSAVFVRGPAEDARDTVYGFAIWRVPADGSPPEPVISLSGEEDRLAPDGTQMSVRRAGEPFVVPRVWYFLPYPVEQGAIAAVPVPEYMGFSWSPGGVLYRHESEALIPLCPGASQVVETCEPSIGFGEAVTSLEWLDRNRFLYLTTLPRRLMLGSLDGWSTVIAEDPQDPEGSAYISHAYISSICRDDSEFVADVTVPDGARVAPGEALQKTWRLRNTGDCAWDDSYPLTFLSGDRLSGPRSAPLGETVEPGEEVDVSVMLLAPAQAGTYQGYWQLFAPDGTPFGTDMYVLIMVP